MSVGAWVEPYAPVAEGIVSLFGPWVEVVAHDVAADVIVAIWNPTSGRRIGDSSLLGLAELDGVDATELDTVAGPYPKVGTHGEQISSVSIPVAGGKGVICINFDRSHLVMAAEVLAAFARPSDAVPQRLFERDWREQISSTVEEWCRQRRLVRRSLTVAQRRELVGEMHHMGLFETRHAAEHAARALGVSRATVYADLKGVR
jgi:predicted transcriptional regulator YheO